MESSDQTSRRNRSIRRYTFSLRDALKQVLLPHQQSRKIWQARPESNRQPPVLETGALPIELRAFSFQHSRLTIRGRGGSEPPPRPLPGGSDRPLWSAANPLRQTALARLEAKVGDERPPARTARLTGLFVGGVFPALRAVLAELQLIALVGAVPRRRIIAGLALSAGERDYGLHLGFTPGGHEGGDPQVCGQTSC